MRGFRLICVAVNLSARQFQDPELVREDFNDRERNRPAGGMP